MDIACAVCAEPWDSYGVRHGDMAEWEADLFRKGAGCPSCKGVSESSAQKDQATDAHLRSIIIDSADDDPHSFDLVNSMGEGERPKWEAPPDPVLFTCPGCEAELREEIDTVDFETPVRYWHGGDKRYTHERDDRLYLESRAPVDKFHKLEGVAYCPDCVDTCDECGTTIFKAGDLDPGDSYAPGASFPHPHHFTQSVCVGCLEEIDSEDNEDDEEKEETEE